MTNEEAIGKILNAMQYINYCIEALQENTKLKADIEQLKAEMEYTKSLMPKMCKTCEYKDEIGWEEPCNTCRMSNNWKLKGQVKHESN